MSNLSIITPNTKMADVIHRNYLLLPVINRFGIKLGFGDKTVDQICTESNINLAFFLDIINTYHDEYYFPKEKMRNYPVQLIIGYLNETHRYYRDKILPEIEEMIEKLISSCKGDCDNLKLIEEFYQKYKDELKLHLKNEEDRFFPYVLELSESKNTHADLEEIRKKYNFSYDIHTREHESVEAKLFDLKNILIKYLTPTYDTDLGNTLLSELFVFEKDLNDHERLEDVILIPALQKIESEYLKRS
jgi:regulator of cell morphogenesis and NO signaling